MAAEPGSKWICRNSSLSPLQKSFDDNTHHHHCPAQNGQSLLHDTNALGDTSTEQGFKTSQSSGAATSLLPHHLQGICITPHTWLRTCPSYSCLPTWAADVCLTLLTACVTNPLVCKHNRSCSPSHRHLPVCFRKRSAQMAAGCWKTI